TFFLATAPPQSDLQTNLKVATTEVRRILLLENQDFVFDFANATVGVTAGRAGRLVSANAGTFLGAIGHGIAMTIGYIDACGINLPHTHPRATEMNFVVEGKFEAGFFMENGARFVMNNVSQGQATIFPMGAIHFEQNLNCDPAIFVAAF